MRVAGRESRWPPPPGRDGASLDDDDRGGPAAAPAGARPGGRGAARGPARVVEAHDGLARPRAGVLRAPCERVRPALLRESALTLPAALSPTGATTSPALIVPPGTLTTSASGASGRPTRSARRRGVLQFDAPEAPRQVVAQRGTWTLDRFSTLAGAARASRGELRDVHRERAEHGGRGGHRHAAELGALTARRRRGAAREAESSNSDAARLATENCLTTRSPPRRTRARTRAS